MASSLETNKILAAVLTAGIIASAASVVSGILYKPTMPEEPAYRIAAASGDESGGGGDETAVEAGIAVLLASADAAAGEKLIKKCTACHTFEEGGADKIGPHLWGVLGREVASVPGFAYSDALTGLDGSWDYDKLNDFLLSPKGFAPGTKMSFAGLKSGEDRANLIMYLRSLASDPLPLPEAEAASADADGGADETEAVDSVNADGETTPDVEGEAAKDVVEETTQATADAAQEVADGAAAVVDDAAGAATETAADLVDQAEEAGTAMVDTAGEVADAAETAAEAASEAPGDAADLATAATDEAVDVAEGVEAQAGEAVSAAAGATADAVTGAVDATADAVTGGGDAGGLVAMIAAGDVADGERVSKKCKACHVFEEGGKNRLGPVLWGVVGRDVAAYDGFRYSNALKELGGRWTYEALDQFLAAPKTFVPGTKMTFAGVKDDQDRADLILYLRSLSSDPVPLPEG